MAGELTSYLNPEDDEWMAAMRRGDFARAWEISDAVLRERIASGETCHHLPRHLQYVWTGAPLAGKRVLVRCYHGLGDTIQFIRFAAPLREIAREVIVWVQPALMELVATARGVDRVLPLHDGTPNIDYDVDIEIMELPHALRAQSHNVAAEAPYLFPPRSNTLPLGPEFNVGIVWEAGDWDPRRSISGRIMRQLRGVSGVRLHSLQRGAACTAAKEITDSDIGTDDITTAAARIRRLDLVVSVDTMVAHLAGAVGIPTWVLLHARCDWRWTGSTRSVWYPTMRLFRQTVPENWASVIQTVRAALMQNATQLIPA
jgi:hypothetical protein